MRISKTQTTHKRCSGTCCAGVLGATVGSANLVDVVDDLLAVGGTACLGYLH